MSGAAVVKNGYDAVMLDPRAALLHGPGLVLLAAPKKRTCMAAAAAIVQSLDLNAMSVVAIVSTPHRALSGIQQSVAQTGAQRLALVSQHVAMDADVLVVPNVADPALAQLLTTLSAHRRVLATVSAANATDAVDVWLDMGVSVPDFLSPSVSIQAMLSVAVLCPHCRRLETVDGAVVGRAGPTVVREAVGCEACGETGFAGHRLVVERLTPGLSFEGRVFRRRLMAGDRSDTLRQATLASGLQSMQQAMMAHVIKGEIALSTALEATAAFS